MLPKQPRGKVGKYGPRVDRYPVEMRAHSHGWATAGRGHVTTGRAVDTPKKQKETV